MAELIARTRDSKPNIIGITEAKPKLNRYKPAIAEFSLTEVGSYKMFEKYIDTEEGRGHILYIDNKLDTTETHMGTNFQENLCVKIKLNQTDRLLVGLVYRSPSNRTSEYNDKLCSLISEATSKGYSHILIMGDFNYPDIDWENWNTKGNNTNSHEYKFVETIQDNFLHQHTRKPTRWRGTDTPHILDLIITNEETMISNFKHVSPLGKSDHCVLNFDFSCYANICSQPKTLKMYNNGNYRDFNQEIKHIKWQDKLNETNNIDTNGTIFLTTIKDLEHRFIPTKTTNMNGRRNTFPIDKKTRDLIKRKKYPFQKSSEQ